MQKDQVSGVLDRTIAVLATMILGWMVKRGWIGESDVATLLPAVVLLPAILWGWWVNRDKALVKSAANVPGTVVVTNPELASSIPSPNVVSNDSAKVTITAAVSEAKEEAKP